MLRYKKTKSELIYMNHTKSAIIDAFWQLLEERPYTKITVRDIVERCQVNRNTFYYHFHDIPELLETTIKSDVDQIIQTNGHFGSPTDCLIPIVERCLKRKKAMLHIYRSVKRDVFQNELERIILYTVTQYVHTVTKDLNIPSEDKTILIQYYKCCLLGYTLDWLDKNMNFDLLKSVTRITDLIGDSLKQAFLELSESSSI